MAFKTDIEIAREANKKPIMEIGDKLGIPAALSHWDALGRAALARGPLDGPGFGANTMRTEFAVLTGLGDEALGLDRLNPYFRFARSPVASLAWALRGAGYATACLHPFDARFFGRDRALPALGFHRFDAAPAFVDAPRDAGLVTDLNTRPLTIVQRVGL